MTRDAKDPGATADAVALAVRAVPGVHDLHPGAPGEVATYLPGRRVEGVRLLEPGCEVHLVLDGTVSTRAVVGAVREATRPVTGVPVHVYVEDVVAAGGSR